MIWLLCLGNDISRWMMMGGHRTCGWCVPWFLYAQAQNCPAHHRTEIFGCAGWRAPVRGAKAHTKGARGFLPGTTRDTDRIKKNEYVQVLAFTSTSWQRLAIIFQCAYKDMNFYPYGLWFYWESEWSFHFFFCSTRSYSIQGRYLKSGQNRRIKFIVWSNYCYTSI